MLSSTAFVKTLSRGSASSACFRAVMSEKIPKMPVTFPRSSLTAAFKVRTIDSLLVALNSVLRSPPSRRKP